MNLDELKQEWRATNAAAVTQRQREALIATTCRRVEGFWGQIFRRDAIEMGAAGLVAFFFGRTALASDRSTLERVGAGIVVAGAAYIVYRLLVARRRPPAPAVDAPLREYCDAELARVDAQIELLQTVLAWYVAPLMMGLLIISLGAHGMTAPFFYNAAFYAVVAWGVYALNQYAVREQVMPLRDQLVALRDQLPLDEGEADKEMAPATETPSAPPKRVHWRGVFIALAIFLGSIYYLLPKGLFAPAYEGEPRSGGPEGAALAKLVAEQRQEKKLVGLAAMAMVDGKIVAEAAAGERKKGSGVPIELGDQWHLGSITKSITATTIARLVEAGKMDWSDTIGERFPDAPIHDDWKNVTIRQLLTHVSGAPANFSFGVMINRPPLGPKSTTARRKAVLKLLATQPAHPPGEKFVYSNVGYTIAGAMAEQATGERWEELVKREVFAPLKLENAGFGPPKSPAKTVDQPRGHQSLGWAKIAAEDDADNTTIIGPAGIAHMTLENLSRYAEEHLRGAQEKGTLLRTETFERLHTPELNDYACGWVEREASDEIPYNLYWHNGSNTMWYALVVFIPGKNLVVAVAANDGDVPNAEAAAWKIVEDCATRLNADGGEALRDGLYPKRSPFNAVRWREDVPEVRVGETWYDLISINGEKTDDILSFCRQEYGDKWRKRFEEDLVEVLIKLKHFDGWMKATLVVRSLESSEEVTLDDVPVTVENRRAIRRAAAER